MKICLSQKKFNIRSNDLHSRLLYKFLLQCGSVMATKLVFYDQIKTRDNLFGFFLYLLSIKKN